MSIGSRAQKMLIVSLYVPYDVRKLSSTWDHHFHQYVEVGTTKNRVAPETQLQLRVKLCLGKNVIKEF